MGGEEREEVSAKYTKHPMTGLFEREAKRWDPKHVEDRHAPTCAAMLSAHSLEESGSPPYCDCGYDERCTTGQSRGEGGR